MSAWELSKGLLLHDLVGLLIAVALFVFVVVVAVVHVLIKDAVFAVRRRRVKRTIKRHLESRAGEWVSRGRLRELFGQMAPTLASELARSGRAEVQTVSAGVQYRIGKGTS